MDSLSSVGTCIHLVEEIHSTKTEVGAVSEDFFRFYSRIYSLQSSLNLMKGISPDILLRLRSNVDEIHDSLIAMLHILRGKVLKSINGLLTIASADQIFSANLMDLNRSLEKCFNSIDQCSAISASFFEVKTNASERESSASENISGIEAVESCANVAAEEGHIEPDSARIAEDQRPDLKMMHIIEELQTKIKVLEEIAAQEKDKSVALSLEISTLKEVIRDSQAPPVISNLKSEGVSLPVGRYRWFQSFSIPINGEINDTLVVVREWCALAAVRVYHYDNQYRQGIPKTSIEVYDLVSKSLINTVTIAGWVDRVIISPDGSKLLLCTSMRDSICTSEVKTYLVRTGALCSSWLTVPCFPGTVAPDGSLVASNSGRLFALDFDSGKVLFQCCGLCGLIAFMPDGKTFAILSWLDDRNLGRYSTIDVVDNWNDTRVSIRTTTACDSIGLSTNGRYVYCTGSGATVDRYDVSNGNKWQNKYFAQIPKTVSIQERGFLMSDCSFYYYHRRDNGEIRVGKTETGEEVQSLGFFEESAVYASFDRRIVVHSRDRKTLHIFEAIKIAIKGL